MTRNEENAEALLFETIALQRVANWLLERYVTQLQELEREILGDLMATDPAGGRTEFVRRERLDALLERLRVRTAEVFDELASRITADMEELGTIEAERERERLAVIFGLNLTGTVSVAAIVSAPVLGITIGDMMRKQASDLGYRLAGTLRRALDDGQTTLEMATTVRDGSPETGEAAVIKPAKTALDTITRTAAADVADEARRAVVEESKEAAAIRYGWQQISILDARTSAICWAYAFKAWDSEYQPLGHSLPFLGGVPRHPHCRSSIILIVLDENQIAEQTFRQWATAAGRDKLERLFGAEKVRLWLDGHLSDNDLIRTKTGTISLDEFRRLGKE